MQSRDSSSSVILGTVHKCSGWHGGGPGVRLPFGEVVVWDSFLGFLGHLLEGFFSVRCRYYNHWPVGRLVPRPRPGPGQLGWKQRIF